MVRISIPETSSVDRSAIERARAWTSAVRSEDEGRGRSVTSAAIDHQLGYVGLKGQSRPSVRIYHGVGRQSRGAISKPSKAKAGATTQQTNVQLLMLVAVCQ